MATVDTTDADLLTSMAGGDEDALRQLYDRHAPWLAARLGRRCADREIVADALRRTPSRRRGEGRAGSGGMGRWRAGCGVWRCAVWSAGSGPAAPASPWVQPSWSETART